MQTARYAHVVTCWVFLGALVVQFALAGYGVMGGSLDPHMEFGALFLHLLTPAVLMITAWLGKLGWQQVLLSFGLFVLLTFQISLVSIGASMDSNVVQGLHPAVALLSAGYVFFFVLGRALDAAPIGSPEARRTPAAS